MCTKAEDKVGMMAAETKNQPTDIEAGLSCSEQVEGLQTPPPLIEVGASPEEKQCTSLSSSEEDAKSSGCFERVKRIWKEYEFIILMMIAVGVAKLYPPLGAEYLHPQVTATWICVMVSMFNAGIGLKTEQISTAIRRVRFNTFVETYNFLFLSAIVFGVTRLLIRANALDKGVADAIAMCACLSPPPGTVFTFSLAAKGDEASAVCITAGGAMLGAVFSPLLILVYLGVEGDVNQLEIILKIAVRILLPFLLAQALRWSSKAVVTFVEAHKYQRVKLQVYLRVYIVYTVFCKTFAAETIITTGETMAMVGLVVGFLISSMAFSWVLLRLFFPDQPSLHVTGLFGCSFKSVAIGVPLISSIYENSPLLALYILPIIVWYPTQQILGPILIPQLSAYVDRHNTRLGISKDDEPNQDESADISLKHGKGPTISEESERTTEKTAPDFADDSSCNEDDIFLHYNDASDEISV
ncbi:bile acid cotransporter 7 [Seminavis robusta]|uniref:Bile acid cotransporter 7 n=1 Tax=Seminavis robusta TaxID=568900 RepID=A0A9N8D9X2_9STRA|nr:bile acid cotransporter 7 [Seminavis robusta]|eukprot:Sro28_g018520.1 bile acid cotransporter 7 (469) ;mRNA; f:12294-13700